MKAGFQGINNGNGKLVLTADNLKFACHELGIPDDKHTLRRVARGFDIYYSGKVHHVSDHTFLIESQYDRQEPVEGVVERIARYEVKIKPTPYLKALCYEFTDAYRLTAYCTCQDWMNYSGDQDLPDVFGSLTNAFGLWNFWCKHSISALLWLHEHGNGNGTIHRCGHTAFPKKVVNECGWALILALTSTQSKLTNNDSNIADLARLLSWQYC